MSKTERAKMTAGEPYQQFDPELIERRKFIRQRIQQLNQEVDNERRNQGFKKTARWRGQWFFCRKWL